MVPGVETYTVCRANREHPEQAEGLGYTYQHHQDLAIWKGRMYVGWNTCQVDEDTYPSREVISTSEDGKTWVIKLVKNATWHDGKALTARRWENRSRVLRLSVGDLI